jgi:hypothetical protein
LVTAAPPANEAVRGTATRSRMLLNMKGCI